MTLSLVLWLAATVAHFAVAAAAARRLLPDASLDEVLFAAVLGGVAGLSIVLHAIAISAGLSLGFGLTGLVIWNTFLWAVTRRPPGEIVRSAPDWVELAALAVLASVVVGWVGAAAASNSLNGSDAAHYHVPFAVNFANGDGLFALPATPHVYPMAGSLISSWFIVPINSTMLIDLATLLPFAITVTSVNFLFRSMTGESGLRWTTWLSLGLFSTPLFRTASGGAADLWFASAFVAVVAIVVTALSRGWRPLDVLLLGGATGLLVGSKTTGAVAFGLLGAGAAAVWLLRRLVGGALAHKAPAGVTAPIGGAIVALGAGGVWLIRNWVLFGSPLAPAGLEVFSLALSTGETGQRTTYYSVLGEMEQTGFDLPAVAAHYIARWLSPLFLPIVLLATVCLIDVATSFGTRRSDSIWWARAGALLLIVFSSVALIWMLIGAPWTALERSDGLTLRYALPVAALGPVLGVAALFPPRFPWWRSRAAGTVAAFVLAAASVWWFWRCAAGAPPQNEMPPLDLQALVVGVAVVVLLARSTPPRGLLVTAVVAGFVIVQGYQFAKADAMARRQALTAFDTEETVYAIGTPQPSFWRTTFLAVRSDEKARGQRCESRRFFFLVRNDWPMEFQPPALTSRSYYAARDIEPARRAGPIGACDYIVTTPAMQATEKGRALVDALLGNAAGETVSVPEQFVVIRAAK